MSSSRPGAGAKKNAPAKAGKVRAGGKAPAAARSAVHGKTAAGTKGPDPAARARRISRLLIARYPDAHCMLDHEDPFQLLVATILAAQCTDERVNMVTPGLFAAYPTPQSLAEAPVQDLE